ncbi:MAG TPA: J domain-containing protein [bacterium]|nr:J domain-containing protein [bacterium]
MRTTLPDYYAILEVPADADASQIRSSHKRLLKRFHPDRNPEIDPRRMALVNAAYEVLSDPTKRAEYDAQRVQSPRPRARARKGDGQRVDVPWPDGFDTVEQARRQARMEARFKEAQEARKQEAARREAEAQADAERRATALRADREAAAQRLAEQRAALQAKAADMEAKTERERRAQMARETAAKVEELRLKDRKRLTRTERRLEPASQQPIDKFIALVWRALDDRQLSHTDRELPPGSQGTWEVLPNGVRWHGAKSSVFVPAGELEWAVKQLFRRGDLTRLTLAHRLRDPDRLAEQGWPIARGLFALLSRLPFFGVTEDPLTLHFDRVFWETLVSG